MRFAKWLICNRPLLKFVFLNITARKGTHLSFVTRNTLSKYQQTKICKRVLLQAARSKCNKRLWRPHVHSPVRNILKQNNKILLYFWWTNNKFLSFLIICITWHRKNYISSRSTATTTRRNSSSHITFIKTNIKEICETNIFLNEKNIFITRFGKNMSYFKRFDVCPCFPFKISPREWHLDNIIRLFPFNSVPFGRVSFSNRS